MPKQQEKEKKNHRLLLPNSALIFSLMTKVRCLNESNLATIFQPLLSSITSSSLNPEDRANSTQNSAALRGICEYYCFSDLFFSNSR
jgi:hypothetical protein